MGPGLRAEEHASLTPKAIATRDRILDAAEAVFSEHGFDAATTREIAALSAREGAPALAAFIAWLVLQARAFCRR